MQVAVAAFAGGPMAVVFVLKKNFDALGKEADSRQILMAGFLFNALLFLVLPFLPDKFPHYVIPIGYTVAARLFAEKYQMSKPAIAESQLYEFRSNWNVLGISVGFLVLFMTLFVVWMFGLDAIGIVSLGERAK